MLGSTRQYPAYPSWVTWNILACCPGLISQAKNHVFTGVNFAVAHSDNGASSNISLCFVKLTLTLKLRLRNEAIAVEVCVCGCFGFYSHKHTVFQAILYRSFTHIVNLALCAAKIPWHEFRFFFSKRDSWCSSTHEYRSHIMGLAICVW